MDDNLVRFEPLLGISFSPVGHFRITDHSAETRENDIKLSLFFNPFLMINIQPIRCQLNYNCEKKGVQRVFFLSDVTEKIAKNVHTVHSIAHCFGHASMVKTKLFANIYKKNMGNTFYSFRKLAP
jgi:hypothetical protein